jgi:hypothetical protein
MQTVAKGDMGAAMELVFLGLLVVLVLGAAKIQSSKRVDPQSAPNKPEARSKPTSRFKATAIAHQPMLSERWADMEHQAESGESRGFADWCYDPATDRQKDRLRDEGAPDSLLHGLTKGQASDLIGMFYSADDDDGIEILQALKLWRSGMTETEARDASRRAYLNPEMRAAYDRRPPGRDAKIFCAAYGLKLPRNCTHDDAAELIDEFIGEDVDLEAARSEIEILVADIYDKEVRQDLQIKKPSQAALVQAMRSFGLHRIAAGEALAEDIAEELIKHNPSLARGV